MQSLRVVATRGAVPELVHRVSAVVVRSDGRRVASTGDPEFPTFLRSAAKPLQAIPLIEDGVVERYAITPAELAIICASHSSEPYQVDVVRGLLARIGCAEHDLACGPHRPLGLDFAVRPPGSPRPVESLPRSSITSNCSGKHAGMLALARHHGWPLDGYERADHPVQRRSKEEVVRWTGVPPSSILEGGDGCGVVTYRLPLNGIAAAYARLGSDGNAADVVRRAMMQHPDLVAGPDRLCTRLMERYPGEVLAKVGAGGVYTVALPGRDLGIALKVEDGDGRATMVALIAVLDQLELEPSPSQTLAQFAEFPQLDTLQRPVGSLRPDGALTFT